MKKVTTEKELAHAIKENEDTITIEGDLAKKTLRIKATGKVAWVIAFGAIGVAVYSIMVTIGTGGASAPATGVTAAFTGGAAISILGASTTATAISIAVAAGGVGVLTKLRSYRIVEKSDNHLVLTKKG
ncbi:hypothetical protein ACR6AP_13690 [Klebsiella variicola]|uniref:hypothetical protein n=1 Tax=Klebsiella variicola TaxID=244366 RepID=UPI003DA28E40